MCVTYKIAGRWNLAKLKIIFWGETVHVLARSCGGHYTAQMQRVGTPRNLHFHKLQEKYLWFENKVSFIMGEGEFIRGIRGNTVISFLNLHVNHQDQFYSTFSIYTYFFPRNFNGLDRNIVSSQIKVSACIQHARPTPGARRQSAQRTLKEAVPLLIRIPSAAACQCVCPGCLHGLQLWITFSCCWYLLT